MPAVVGLPLVLAQDADGSEADPGIRRDRPRVLDGRVDGQAMVPAPLEEEACDQANSFGAEAATLPALAEVDVDTRVAIFRGELLLILDTPRHLRGSYHYNAIDSTFMPNLQIGRIGHSRQRGRWALQMVRPCRIRFTWKR